MVKMLYFIYHSHCLDFSMHIGGDPIMYTRNSTSPKKFGRPTFARKAKPPFNNSKSSFKRGSGASYRKGGANKRSRGERIDFSRFIKKGTQIEEKAYVSK